MRTTKPISTISFNTEEFLKHTLDGLIKSRIISFYAFVSHFPEDDEGGTKQHFHLYIEPSKLIQTDDLRDMFKEYDFDNPEKPLGVLPFRNSKFEHWYMYACHNKAYLASKGESRKYHYTFDDFVSSDSDNLTFLSRSISHLDISPYDDMISAQNRGLQFSQYVEQCGVPIVQIKAFENAWYLLMQNRALRGEHEIHPDSAYEESALPDSLKQNSVSFKSVSESEDIDI